jgi:predicted acyl esterase
MADSGPTLDLHSALCILPSVRRFYIAALHLTDSSMFKVPPKGPDMLAIVQLTAPVAGSALFLAIALSFPHQTSAQAQPNSVAQYFATQVDREDMVRIPMRDGKRLNPSLFFPKIRPRQNLPTVLIFFPYLINPTTWPQMTWPLNDPRWETSNSAARHRSRISIASSSFPVYERNLNTGGPNYNEKEPVVAHNQIHHGPGYPSAITLTVVPSR